MEFFWYCTRTRGEERRKSRVYLNWNLRENQLHNLVLAQTCAHPFILQQLVVAGQVFAAAIHFQNHLVTLAPRQPNFVLTLCIVQNFPNKFASWSDKRLSNTHFTGFRRELKKIDFDADLAQTIEGFAKRRLKYVTRKRRAFVLQKTNGERPPSVWFGPL